jgi:superfamily II DNA or RNA helicase
MRLILSNDIKISGAPSDIRKKLKEDLTMINPKWLENERMGYWQGKTPKTLKFFIEDKSGLHIPRGMIGDLLELTEANQMQIIDKKNILEDIDFKFTKSLRPYQNKAVEKTLIEDQGVLEAATGSGKTVMAIYMIASRKQPTLIIVHTKELMMQWQERLCSFLDIDKNEIGLIGSGKKKIGKKITIGMVQTIYKMAPQVAPYIGHLIVDECHRAPSRTFYEAITEFDCKYILGLSATPFRRDGMTPLIKWFIGPTVHKIDINQMQEINAITQIEVVFRSTDFKSPYDGTLQYSSVIKDLTENDIRNKQIAMDAIDESKNGASLILSDRKHHCKSIQEMIVGFGHECLLLTGDMKQPERQKVVNDLNNGKSKIVVATGQLIGEGFDCKNLYALFLATPIKFNGRLLQYVGRIMRPADGKDTAKIYDYIDWNIPALKWSARSRARTYEKEFGCKNNPF